MYGLRRHGTCDYHSADRSWRVPRHQGKQRGREVSSQNRLVHHREFKDVCETMDYDPSVELITRRNDLAEIANSYELQAMKESDCPAEDIDHGLVGNLMDEAEIIRQHVERIDLKLMPYIYGRKSSHSLQGEDGSSLLEAFAKVATQNLSKSNGASKTQH